MRRAIYAGSFDPLTRGHIDVLEKALQTFDEVIVSIGTNPKKTRTFDLEQSVSLIYDSIKEALPEAKGWAVDSFAGQSIVSYAKELAATHIVRGLRQVSDFNDEFVFTGANERIDPSIIVTHFLCKAEFLHVSSSTARVLAELGENTSWLVTPVVEKALREKFNGN